jgi:purine-nucleoside phosphorylase
VKAGLDARGISRFRGRADTAIVLGSGLSVLERWVEVILSQPYRTIEGMPHPTARGHPGRLSLVRIGTREVILLCGRVHMYEGFGFEEAGSAVTIASELGCRRIIITHAAGGLHAGVPIGSWLVPSHVVSFPCRSAWQMSVGAIPGDFGKKIALSGLKGGVDIRRGTLFWTPGPVYETAAEARAAFALGADAASMSALPELAAARKVRMETAVMSLITNHTANVSQDRTAHHDVVRRGRNGAKILLEILKGLPS